MPLPLFLGIAVGAAAVGGIGTGIHGAVKMKDANDTMKYAGERHQKNMKKFESKNKATTKCMDNLGKKEMCILSTFERFSDVFEQIQNRPEFEDVVLNGNVLPKYNGEELKKVSIGACALMGGLGGAALGTAGGFAAAGATTAAVMALGTASTGTAIATLSGAAATNATLAALGGGAIAAGGGGIALGTTMLGVTTAGVGLLVGGIVFSITGSAISKKADKAYLQMKKAEKQINLICNYLVELKATAMRYMQTLSNVEAVYSDHMVKLINLVENEGKVDWKYYTDDEKMIVKNTVLLVGLLYKMCQVKLVLVSDSKDELNKVNYVDVNENEKAANEVLKKFGYGGSDLSEQALENAMDYSQDEKYCIALIAVITYFAKCDGEISNEEREILNETVECLTNSAELSAVAKSEIKSIVSTETFVFYKMRTYLDVLELDAVIQFNEIIDSVIKSNGKISKSERIAKEKFDSYLKERKDIK